MKATIPGGNAAALNQVAGEYYTPLQYGPSYSGGLTYNLTVDGSGRVARPSFIGRTVIEVPDPSKPISPDNVATIKPIKNPTFRVTHPDGTTVSKTIPGEFNALPNGTADAFDGVEDIRRVTRAVVTGQNAEYYGNNPIAGLRRFAYASSDRAIKVVSAWIDRFEDIPYSPHNTAKEGAGFGPNTLSFFGAVKTNRLESDTTEALLKWLDQNPVTVIYQLNSPTSKYMNADLPLAPGVNQFSASDENGVLQNVTVDVIPGPDVAIPYAQNAQYLNGYTASQFEPVRRYAAPPKSVVTISRTGTGIPFTYFQGGLPQANTYYEICKFRQYNFDQAFVFVSIGSTDRTRFQSTFLVRFGRGFAGYKPEFTILGGQVPSMDGSANVDFYKNIYNELILRVKSDVAGDNYGGSIEIAVIGL